MFKLVGILLIFVSAIRAATEVTLYEKRKLKQISGFISLLKHIRLQIDCYCIPILEILDQCPRDIFDACEISYRKDSFDNLLSECTILSGEPIRLILESFASELGKSYKEEQVRGCNHYIDALLLEKNKLSETLPSKIRVIYTLFIGGAAALALLII